MSLAVAERAALADALAAAGPAKPTLCAGWTTGDLLAHLLVRERLPWAAPGILVPALAPLTERAMRGFAAQPWVELVAQFRAGPPWWAPYRIPAVDALANGVEYFVHHEDVRRGEPGWRPREPDVARDDELWAVLGRVGRFLYRRSSVGVALRRPDGAQRVVRTGTGIATITGEPGELLLHAFGRDAARVHVDGAGPDVEALAAARRGI